MMVVRKTSVLVALLAHLLAVLPFTAMAQEPTPVPSQPPYRIGSGDVVSITVPQRPNLNRELVVSTAGAISIPLVGDVQVRGLTVEEARGRILAALRDVYPSVNELEVRAQPFGRFAVYVVGAVGRVGKYHFRDAPNLWDAIREAGGPESEAALDAVRIVNDPKGGGRSRIVNVQDALEASSVDQLPDLLNGDTVIVPAKETSYRGSQGVDVYGSVVKPGTYRVTGGISLVEALLLAGGSLPEARMSRIALVRIHNSGLIETITVDVRKFLEKGDPLSNPMIRAGDTIYVPRQNAFLWALKNDAGVFLGLITSAVALAILVTDNNNK